MARPAFRPNPDAKRKFSALLKQIAQEISPHNPAEGAKMLRDSAARFVHAVADITPPAHGNADQAAKKAGENAIVADLLKIAVPLQGAGSNTKAVRSTLATAEDLLNLHVQQWAGGKIHGMGKDGKLWMPQAAFNAAAKMLMDRIGWLAAGLNAAAEKLGRPLPLWIRRHGSKYGKISVRTTANRLAIRVVQDVPYADGIKGYQRKWDFALEREIRALHRQVEIRLRTRVRQVHLRDL